MEHAGEPLSAYEIRYDTAGGSGKLLNVGKPTLFEPLFVQGRMRLFGPAETLGEEGRLKVFRPDYSPRRPPSPGRMQPALFPYGGV